MFCYVLLCLCYVLLCFSIAKGAKGRGNRERGGGERRWTGWGEGQTRPKRGRGEEGDERGRGKRPPETWVGNTLAKQPITMQWKLACFLFLHVNRSEKGSEHTFCLKIVTKLVHVSFHERFAPSMWDSSQSSTTACHTGFHGSFTTCFHGCLCCVIM